MSINATQTRRVFTGVHPTQADGEGVTVYYSDALPSGSTPGYRGTVWEPQGVITQARNDITDQRHAVCVVQNASERWARALRDGFGLDQSFFDRHFENPERSSLWKLQNAREVEVRNGVVQSGRTEQTDGVGHTKSSWHIDGVFEHYWAMDMHVEPSLSILTRKPT